MRFNNYWTYRRILLTRRFLRSLWGSRSNVKAFARGRPAKAGPFMAELDITYACDLRCRMCARWKDRRRDPLSLAEYRRLAGEFDALGVHQISIAGGEPLLREDVFDVIAAFAARGMSVNLCTNGMQLEKFRQAILASGATCVTVSLDGATAECHDRIRGLSGSHVQVSRGIASFLDQRSDGVPILRVRMTVSEVNAREIGPFYRQWRAVADDVLFQPVHHCADSYYTGMHTAALDLDPGLLAEQLRGTPMQTDAYMKQLVESLETTGSYPAAPCFAGLLMVRIDPWGNVYPCLEQHVCVGSVRQDNFAAIWNSEALQQERRRLSSGRPCRCWYNNTAMIGHFGSLLNGFGRGVLKTPLLERFRKPLPRTPV
jgi:MoaA/NifB/PqqE/SkfB family radical SAM enzyme